MPLLRAKYVCPDVEHPVQEMVIAFYKDSYVRPHRHIGTSESFHVAEGEIDVIFFDEVGKPTNRERLGVQKPTFQVYTGCQCEMALCCGGHRIRHCS